MWVLTGRSRRGADRPPAGPALSYAHWMTDGSLLDAARQAYEANDWAAAHAGFVAARSEAELDSVDWFRLAWSAWWLGRVEDCLDAFEQSYSGFLADGAPAQAAMSALYLSIYAAQRGDAARSNGWCLGFTACSLRCRPVPHTATASTTTRLPPWAQATSTRRWPWPSGWRPWVTRSPTRTW
jgi:hypothetical protein